ncbi:STAS domain-containing protein [Actinoplanes sp. NPDC051859]|uniref:STAS domain-containing protein n=1 Tax=Actinoplanes sp. NPDC051859 TaxID=3363909 RepID=UPI0037BAFD82
MNEPPLWQYDLHRDGGTSTVALAGEIDLQNADEVQNLLLEEMQRGDTSAVEVDLRQVSFLDSTAVGCLISGYHAAKNTGCGLAVVNPSRPAHRILSLTGVLAVLTGT